MNIKMATYSQLSTTESKKQTKQTTRMEQNYSCGDHLEGYQLEGRRGRMGKKVQGLRSIIGRYKNRQGDVKNSVGNGEAKELMHDPWT